MELIKSDPISRFQNQTKRNWKITPSAQMDERMNCDFIQTVYQSFQDHRRATMKGNVQFNSLCVSAPSLTSYFCLLGLD